MDIGIFNDFELYEKASEKLINKFEGKVPEQLIEVWKQYGFGSILNGYLKIVNPDEFHPLLEEVYIRSKEALVLFTTSMGDLLIWEDNKYLLLLNFRRGKMQDISSGFEFFFSDLEDDSSLQNDLDWLPYPDAIEKYGKPAFDECFGYVPLLGLGGSEKIENLEKVKLIENIYLNTQFTSLVE
ncbi:T6SS immunity protein Tdi1 domain-containing protein [Paenibacillus polymyxa]|uniref:T6SS immunity protein Tdi1 domain-containing protein n=1 Tax=Paenibacillus polymyxa TaxID=1406 RepID=UPI000471819F|nr:T6SS immunity protein Tdi1 domain-containing protein [Paenibacillus polymyxa]